ncbi:hypothetical protein HDU83_005046 [Entophlyctis luteolus]|nr:hypothetical protein HDU82_005550 [Entophlyctis luteolus]KAJ3354595.1 hypothetical protein HDU83_005046 [Entophlyctis luteolus]KAJ3388006.1 hypothetical protein HDU84_000330 [Entophlyctis sp. JEL0112]
MAHSAQSEPVPCTPPPQRSSAEPVSQIVLHAVMLRIPALLLVLLLLLGFLAPYHLPMLFAGYYAFCNVFLLVSTLRTVLGVVCVCVLSVRQSFASFENNCSDPSCLPIQDIRHVIILPNYKEDIDNLRDTLNVLASHSGAKSSYKVCLAMEATESACEEKAESLVSEYSEHFLSIEYSVHPADIPGELRGKSANVSWAARHMAKSVNPSDEQDAHRHIFTIMDADSCFTNDYFLTVSKKYCENVDFFDRRLQIFVPFSVFDRNSTDISPFVRMFDVSWSFAQMGYFIPGYYFCPALSAYSVPFDLAVAVDFWATGTDSLGEDTRMTLKLAFATGYRLRMTQIYSPVSQCNVEGASKSWASSLYARTVQAKRHNWGGNLNWVYSMRMAISMLVHIESGSDTPRLPDSFIGPKPKNIFARASKAFNRWLRHCTIIFHQFEISIWTVHVVVINLMAVCFIPNTGPAFLYGLSDAYWRALSGTDAISVDGGLIYVVQKIAYVQLSLVPMIVVIAIGFEGMHWWNSVGRWKLNERRAASTLPVASENGGFLPKAVLLGKRSVVTCKPRQWYHLFEWVMFPLVAVYFVVMLIYVAVMQVFYDRIGYVTAAKPTLPVNRLKSEAQHYLVADGVQLALEEPKLEEEEAKPAENSSQAVAAKSESPANDFAHN